MAAATVMMITYGHAVRTNDDLFIRIADKGAATIEAVGAVGVHIVDFIPWREARMDFYQTSSLIHSFSSSHS